MSKTKISKNGVKNIPKKEMEILQSGNPVLREVSSPIPDSEINSSKTKKTILLLQEAINSQPDAAAISAVQIGKLVRLFVISKKVFDSENTSEQGTESNKNDLIFINPKIIKVSKNKQTIEEGCLSVRYVYGKVTRPEKATVEAYDENGKKFRRGFSGLLAQIVQHENDHLNGILFTDIATDIQKLSKKEYEEMLKNI